MKTLIAALISLTIAGSAGASGLSDRVETWLKHNFYPYSGEPFDVTQAHCTPFGNNDWHMFSCDLTLRDPYTNPNLPPVYITLNDQMVMVTANDPLDLAFCEFQVCRG